MSEEQPILWGKELIRSIHETKPTREAYVDNLTFVKSANMNFAQEGVGKSLLALQHSVQGTVEGSKIFGEFEVIKPMNVLHLQMERPEEESLERLKTMIEHTPFNEDRFVLDCSFQEFNLKNGKHMEKAIARIDNMVKKTFKEVHMIKFDPIYPMVRGGIRSDEDADPIIEFSKRLQYEFGASIEMIHHANRGIKDAETGERKGQDMFGAGSFAWHCTGIYFIKKTKEGTSWHLQKSNNSNLEREINMIFDRESQLSFVKNQRGKISKTDILVNYLKACESQEKVFTFDDMEAVSGLSTSYLRELTSGHLKSQLYQQGKSSSGAYLYKFNSIK